MKLKIFFVVFTCRNGTNSRTIQSLKFFFQFHPSFCFPFDVIDLIQFRIFLPKIDSTFVNLSHKSQSNILFFSSFKKKKNSSKSSPNPQMDPSLFIISTTDKFYSTTGTVNERWTWWVAWKRYWLNIFLYKHFDKEETHVQHEERDDGRKIIQYCNTW